MKGTICWNCSRTYPMGATSCPHCGATNANDDLEKAVQESISRALQWKWMIDDAEGKNQ